MFKFSGALFLTRKIDDIGFPAFRKSFGNMIYTCSLNEKLQILKFYTVPNMDSFHYLNRADITNEKDDTDGFAVGDTFPFMLVRGKKGLTELDLRDVDTILRKIEENRSEIFSNLQVLRFLSSKDIKYHNDTVKAISEAAALFDLDESSHLSFLSSEISLSSKGTRGLFGHQLEIVPLATIDDNLRRFIGLSEIEALRILRQDRISYDSDWAYLYIYYDSKWGMDEFLYIVGKEYLGRLLLGQSVSPTLSAKIARLIIGSYNARLNTLAQEDRDVVEIFEDIVDDDVFYELCKASPDILEAIFRVIYRDLQGLDLATTLAHYLFRHFYALPAAAGAALVNMTKLEVSSLGSREILDLSTLMARSVDFETPPETVVGNRDHLIEFFNEQLDSCFPTRF